MNTESWDIINQGGLRYFGDMTASISHEIKNCLAIMNENAGLLQDLLAAVQTGRQLDLNQIDQISNRITKQIYRIDDITKRMNVFSHSVDLPEKTIDVGEVLNLAVLLGSRIASNRMIEIKLILPKHKIFLSTQFFFLLHLVWLIMDSTMTAVGPDKTMEIKPVDQISELKISFCSQGNIKKGFESILCSQAAQKTMKTLSAQLIFSETDNEIILKVAKKTQG
ncbi:MULTISPECIES: sensor histidine kinase [Desulfobacula]|uniref:histidine kinase n=2 Tax=Desulfobacula TaxID=28222 RepID=K0NEF3_DESTT|nr:MULTISPECIES: histidine kinase dimerisation and phosphoacceptor region protein [Desulfobacula]CCK79275.1 histidine kinase dimerisation and phosphoacceptor region protein [Desulfobacula toluolica Tol2]SDT83799.1 hypothetical protein SAMN04487931_10117 [Desulfobacula phenolica]